jgi:hypothetical protein
MRLAPKFKNHFLKSPAEVTLRGANQSAAMTLNSGPSTLQKMTIKSRFRLANEVTETDDVPAL